MKQKNITLKVDMGIKKSETVEIWTSDLTYDYVKINAEYST